MLIRNWKKDIFTIPNFLSLFRLCLIPIYIKIYLSARYQLDYYVASGILAVSCLTDLIDGYIARRFHMISSLGKILDPFADKATQFSLILCLSMKHRFLWYLILLFVIKEGFQMIAGAIQLHKGKILKGALLSGKICTAVLFISLILLVMLSDLSKTTVMLVVTIDMCFMLVSFINYLFTYFSSDDHFQVLDSSPDQDGAV